MTNASNLPAPFGGIDETIPIASLQHPFCETLLNFNTTPGGIVLRNGDSLFASCTSGAGTRTGFRCFAYGNSKVIVVASSHTTNPRHMDFIDGETNVVGYSTANLGSENFYPVYFNGVLFMFNPNSYAPGVQWNGAAFAAIGYTGTSLLPVGGDVYKKRGYYIQYNEPAYWYTNILSTSGALNKVDLSDVVSQKCALAIIAPITIADNVSAVTLQAFVFDNGEVIFYGGSYPDSESWGEIGRSKIGQPVDYNAYIPYQGDSLVLCDSGVVSLRDLFLKGSEKAELLSVNARVQKTWQTLIQQARTQFSVPNGPISLQSFAGGIISGLYDGKSNRIIIILPFYDSSGTTLLGNFQFIFNTIQQSWYFHQSYGTTWNSANGIEVVIDSCWYKNKVLLLGNAGNARGASLMTKEGATNFTDRNAANSVDIGYAYNFISAPIPFPKTQNYETTQIEPIIESDLYAATNWYLVGDFGRQTTNAQTTDALTTSPAKPAINVGIQNITFVQVQMSGTTVAAKTVGLQLYSYNVWYNMGAIASR